MKKLFINHIRFMALPVVISTGVRMVGSYSDDTLGFREVVEILFSGILLVLLLFPVYLFLRAVWRKLFVQKTENQ
jgi:glucose-6-phosphate 1-dehydrogenase